MATKTTSARVLEPVGASPRPVQIVNHLNGEYADNIASDVRDGLSAAQKFIPCKYFYDAYGSKLFEEICGLPEYYPTRTELSILRELAPQLMASSGDRMPIFRVRSTKIGFCVSNVSYSSTLSSNVARNL